MRVGFAGSPEFAVAILDTMLRADIHLVRVLSQPPRRSGRGRKVRPCPVQLRAEAAGVECHTPSRLRGQESLVADLDVLVVAAYGLILPEAIFCAPTHGSVNVHASLLPRWRGASPVEHAILHNDEETGISLMKIEEGLDTGPVYEQRACRISTGDTTQSLTTKLADLGGDMITEFLGLMATNTAVTAKPQSTTGVMYAPRLTSSDARIDWQAEAAYIERQIRAFQGRSTAFATIGDIRINVIEASVIDGKYEPGKIYPAKDGAIVGCGTQGLNLHTVQLNRGKGRPIPIKAAMNGYSEVFAEQTRWDVR